MTNLEHYFENLLMDGQDSRNNINKKTLTEDEINAVNICYQYILYSLFNGRDDFENFLNEKRNK